MKKINFPIISSKPTSNVDSNSDHFQGVGTEYDLKKIVKYLKKVRGKFKILAKIIDKLIK